MVMGGDLGKYLVFCIYTCKYIYIFFIYFFCIYTCKIQDTFLSLLPYMYMYIYAHMYTHTDSYRQNIQRTASPHLCYIQRPGRMRSFPLEAEADTRSSVCHTHKHNSHPGLDPAQLIGMVVIGEIMCCRCFWKQAPPLKGRECFCSAYSVSVNFNTKTLAAQYLGHSRPHDANMISHMS